MQVQVSALAAGWEKQCHEWQHNEMPQDAERCCFSQELSSTEQGSAGIQALLFSQRKQPQSCISAWMRVPSSLTWDSKTRKLEGMRGSGVSNSSLSTH